MAATGFIPNTKQEILGAIAGGYTPGEVKTLEVPGIGPVTYNTAETVKTFDGFKQPAIIPPKGSAAGIAYQKNFYLPGWNSD